MVKRIWFSTHLEYLRKHIPGEPEVLSLGQAGSREKDSLPMNFLFSADWLVIGRTYSAKQRVNDMQGVPPHYVGGKI